MEVPEGFLDAVRGGRAVVATGFDVPLVRSLVSVLAEQPSDHDHRWRLLIDETVADSLAYEFVLATAVEQLRAEGTLALKTSAEPLRTLIASRGEIYAVAGPLTTPTLLCCQDVDTVEQIHQYTRARYDRGTRTDLDEPPRDRLLASARTELSAEFAAELEASLQAADTLHRQDAVDVLTLMLAIGARTDHLFSDVRVWAEGVGVAARELFVERKDELIDRGLIETIKIPMGPGHPRYRLRVIDEALADCAPAEITWVLEERYRGQGTPDSTGTSPSKNW